ncbi:type II toxin-antitoxin system RelE family toxin [Oscillatoria salina]|uniref:type II toxin-antitoxin system RelE family toxin n=1 Tax=Oscillatoria salina TaxID=331517 RepID=UPI0013BC3732|nr:type II toxin-antitoxin system mRNA interferase toxin, RelE/StbE family [Oscillatoria salina]MBZ8182789.1 type II toxin-antitoxin system mRNA interferase toxin, RelE/StbE family [Oscillatoria salina IIICB1]NET90020.1 type II toxin-antitoxin system mRNA interferase toxin, RelE/StbE family [Kamptonema sp. SIO1D9]
MDYEIEIIPLAIKLLAKIKDQREQKLLRKKIEKLKQEPEKQGKPLTGQFKGYRSVRAVGQRYRIIYRIDKNRIIVVIIGVGMRQEGSRQDVYEVVGRLLEEE